MAQYFNRKDDLVEVVLVLSQMLTKGEIHLRSNIGDLDRIILLIQKDLYFKITRFLDAN